MQMHSHGLYYVMCSTVLVVYGLPHNCINPPIIVHALPNLITSNSNPTLIHSKIQNHVWDRLWTCWHLIGDVPEFKVTNKSIRERLAMLGKVPYWTGWSEPPNKPAKDSAKVEFTFPVGVTDKLGMSCQPAIVVLSLKVDTRKLKIEESVPLGYVILSCHGVATIIADFSVGQSFYQLVPFIIRKSVTAVINILW